MDWTSSRGYGVECGNSVQRRTCAASKITCNIHYASQEQLLYEARVAIVVSSDNRLRYRKVRVSCQGRLRQIPAETSGSF